MIYDFMIDDFTIYFTIEFYCSIVRVNDSIFYNETINRPIVNRPIVNFY